MELSLFSRDVIAMSTAVALSHNMFDGALYLGICDKIVPGLFIAALTFGHLPAVFVPGGPLVDRRHRHQWPAHHDRRRHPGWRTSGNHRGRRIGQGVDSSDDKEQGAGDQGLMAPTLTGLGERAHLLNPDIGLDTHVQDVLGVLEYEDLHDVVLVGHSYG